MWALSGAVMAAAKPGQREKLLLGDTWASCPWLIAMLSAPAFVAMLWAMKQFAPARLRLAGAGAGFAAGALGALVYSLHCPEMAPPFLALWYVLGMLIPTAVGCLVGPRLLRW